MKLHLLPYKEADSEVVVDHCLLNLQIVCPVLLVNCDLFLTTMVFMSFARMSMQSGIKRNKCGHWEIAMIWNRGTIQMRPKIHKEHKKSWGSRDFGNYLDSVSQSMKSRWVTWGILVVQSGIPLFLLHRHVSTSRAQHLCECQVGIFKYIKLFTCKI